jgi:hypothetical protein
MARILKEKEVSWNASLAGTLMVGARVWTPSVLMAGRI